MKQNVKNKITLAKKNRVQPDAIIHLIKMLMCTHIQSLSAALNYVTRLNELFSFIY